MTAVVAQQEESPMAHQVKINLDKDQILQRYLVRRIFREIEFKIVETDGTEHVGYITGLDDKCIQISTTPKTEIDEPRAVLIFWPIRRIEETGGKVDDLPHEHRSKIRSFSHALRAQCEATLNGSNRPAPQRRPKDPPLEAHTELEFSG